jgi:hypothetical protein
VNNVLGIGVPRIDRFRDSVLFLIKFSAAFHKGAISVDHRIIFCYPSFMWAQPPMCNRPEFRLPSCTPGDYGLLKDVGLFSFLPLINSVMNVVAEVSIILLRPEAPRRVITQGGDMDNRLKTLFDALAKPPHPNALPARATPSQDQTPFYCLLEDDNLIVKLTVETEQLLEEVADKVVDLTIRIRTRVTQSTIGNQMFI